MFLLFCFHSVTADVDYGAVILNITFNSTQDSVTFPVNLVNDMIAEGNEQFEVFIKSLPDNPVIIGNPGFSIGTIINDDTPSKIFYNFFFML